jgi:hypothetical protein
MRKLILSIFIATIFVFSNAFAQEPGDNQTSEDIDDFFAEQNEQKSAIALPTVPTGLSLETMDEETRQLYLETLREHYIYRKSGYKHRQEVFRWQLFSSKVTFYIVILLVLSGIYFSGVQFHNAMKQSSGGNVADAQVTEFSASAEGIKVSSPVLGVIILSISLAFFYLYLVYVYPIEEIL